jgi:hypothetical protein
MRIVLFDAILERHTSESVQRALREAAFHWWRARLARRDAEAATFAPVRVVADTTVDAAGRIEIVSAGRSPGARRRARRAANAAWGSRTGARMPSPSGAGDTSGRRV